MEKRLRNVLIGAVSVLLVAGVIIGLRLHRTSTAASTEKNHIKLFKEVIGIVKKSYVEDVDQKKLIKGAIDGMLATLDPHSNYLPPEPYTEMKIAMAGSFGGLGIEINIKDDKLTVISPIEDTPAFRAGIKANDHIWKIDDKLTKGLSITQSVGLMRGQKGTKVTLHIMREGHDKSLTFPLIRDIIKTKSLRARTIEPGFGLIRLIQFQERTGEDFANALKNVHAENPELKGLIIDLRNNPGGLVNSAVQVADLFIGEGKNDGTIVSTNGREPSMRKFYYAHMGPKESGYPIVVLINGGSASASEILAGALQDSGRAIIMGTQSYGKGSVQSVISLPNGAGLKLTTARYYTPKGRSIQAKGLTPDIIVGRLDPPKKDPKEEKSFHEHELIKMFNGAAPSQETKTPAKKLVPADPELVQDFQLSRAVEMLKGLDVFKSLAKQPQVNAASR
jgi:carboxyl-terminal processing protease